MALSDDTKHFFETAFKLALSDDFMGGPTPAERKRIEAIRAEIAELAALRQELDDARDAFETSAEGVHHLTKERDRLRQELQAQTAKAETAMECQRIHVAQIERLLDTLHEMGYSERLEASIEADQKVIDLLGKHEKEVTMKQQTISTAIEALKFWRTTLEFDEERMYIDLALADLEQAEGVTWEPVPDGKYCDESPDGSEDWCIKVTDDGNSIWQYSSSDDEWVEIGSLSFWGFRLAKRTATPQPAVGDN